MILRFRDLRFVSYCQHWEVLCSFLSPSLITLIFLLFPFLSSFFSFCIAFFLSLLHFIYFLFRPLRNYSFFGVLNFYLSPLFIHCFPFSNFYIFLVFVLSITSFLLPLYSCVLMPSFLSVYSSLPLLLPSFPSFFHTVNLLHAFWHRCPQ